MTPIQTHVSPPASMSYLVVVRPEPPGQFTAQVVNIPEVRATAPTEAEAIARARSMLTKWLATAHWVHVDVPTPRTGHPLLEWPFSDPNDPNEQAYLQELARMRQEDMERTQKEFDDEDRARALREQSQPCSSSSSTPTI